MGCASTAPCVKAHVALAQWTDMTEAMPAYATIIGMPFTHNIAYGVIGGLFVWFVAKLVSYKMHPIMENWPGAALYRRREKASKRGMFM